MILNDHSCVRKVAQYGNVCIGPRLHRALSLFRLGATPLNRNIEFDKCISCRNCLFCLKNNFGSFIEDEYHLCFECPLYNHARRKLFFTLASCGFHFTNASKHGNVCKYVARTPLAAC